MNFLIILFSILLTTLISFFTFASETNSQDIYTVQVDVYKNGKMRCSRSIVLGTDVLGEISQENQFGYKTYSKINLEELVDGSLNMDFESGEILPDDNFVLKQTLNFKPTDFFHTVSIKTKENAYEYIVSLHPKIL